MHQGCGQCSQGRIQKLWEGGSWNRKTVAVTIHWTGLLDWTTGLTFDLKCSIYVKKIMFNLCEKNYIDRAHGFFAQVQYNIGVSSFPSGLV